MYGVDVHHRFVRGPKKNKKNIDHIWLAMMMYFFFSRFLIIDMCSVSGSNTSKYREIFKWNSTNHKRWNENEICFRHRSIYGFLILCVYYIYSYYKCGEIRNSSFDRIKRWKKNSEAKISMFNSNTGSLSHHHHHHGYLVFFSSLRFWSIIIKFWTKSKWKKKNK